MKLRESDKSILLEIARSAVRNHLGVESHPMSTSVKEHEVLTRPAGVFVSLYVEDQLRGCIGTFSEAEPLYIQVRKMAISAAFHDNRFVPIGREELDEMNIEISVLTPRKRIYSPDEIEIGKHGIYIISGTNRGTLLPQVAEKNGWDVITFLEYCARQKAGLSYDGWKEAELYVYEAIIFGYAPDRKK